MISAARIKACIPKRMDDLEAEENWQSICKAIMGVFTRKQVTMSFEEYYRTAYSMVLGKQGDRLYKGFHDTVLQHLTVNLRPLLEKAINNNFLEVLEKCWTNFMAEISMIRDILMYVDRSYVEHHKIKLRNLHDISYDHFRTAVLDYPPIHDHLKTSLLDFIAQERQNVHIWMTPRNVFQMLLDLGRTGWAKNSREYYEQVFEAPFIFETKEYYRQVGQKFMEENDIISYIKKVHYCLDEERSRKDKYLDADTVHQAVEVVRDELIRKYLPTLVNSGMITMIEGDKRSELSQLYELLSALDDGIDAMAHELGLYLRQKLSELKKPSEDINPIQYIVEIFDIKDHFEEIVRVALKNDKKLLDKIRFELENFLNTNTKSSEFLSLYIDDQLRKGFKDIPDGEVELMLDKIVALFRYLKEKDLFEKFYKNHLAKRLIHNKTISMDLENSVITKLRDECGSLFTTRMEGMFKDMGTSESLMDEYRGVSQYDKFEFSIQVLTEVHWPLQVTPMCELPNSMMEAFESFRNFYTNKHNGRKLNLLTSLGTADLIARFYEPLKGVSNQTSSDLPFKETSKILAVNTYQMLVLLCFNDADQMTFQQISDATKIPEKELNRVLQSLALGKPSMRVLSRVSGRNKEIEKTDIFTVNDGFKSKLSRVQIKMVSNRNEVEKDSKTRDKVDDDRRHEVEASIVRVMKSRKRMVHNDLIAEVTNQMTARFVPDPLMIKRRIESLLERNYLERDSDDMKTYNYVS